MWARLLEPARGAGVGELLVMSHQTNDDPAVDQAFAEPFDPKRCLRSLGTLDQGDRRHHTERWCRAVAKQLVATIPETERSGHVHALAEEAKGTFKGYPKALLVSAIERAMAGIALEPELAALDALDEQSLDPRSAVEPIIQRMATAVVAMSSLVAQDYWKDEIVKHVRFMPAPYNTLDLVRMFESALADARLEVDGGDGASGQGHAIRLPDPEPWPDPVDGAALLTEIAATFNLHVKLLAGADTALSLWVVFAHALDVFQIAPMLGLTSPTKRCGKTNCLILAGAMAPRTLTTANISTAAVYRTIEKFRPTLLVDELDRIFADQSKADLVGVLNAAHVRQMAYVVRSTGDDHEPSLFSVWSAKGWAYKGKLPRSLDTLEDRSIIVPMRRRAEGEEVERLRLDKLDAFAPLCRQAARWTADNLDALRTTADDPAVPAELHDRARDNWRPLLAIADVAGGPWPERAREAAVILSGGADGDDDAGVTLLADVRELFLARNRPHLTTETILRHLRDLEDRPWGDWQGKPLSSQALARLLKPFGIKPRQVQPENCKGYVRADFADAFERYVGGEPPNPAANPKPPKPAHNDATLVSETDPLPLRNSPKPETPRAGGFGLNPKPFEPVSGPNRTASDGNAALVSEVSDQRAISGVSQPPLNGRVPRTPVVFPGQVPRVKRTPLRFGKDGTVLPFQGVTHAR